MNSKNNFTLPPNGLKSIGGRMFLSAVAAMSLAGAALGSPIGMNFVRGPGGDVAGVANATANSLAPTDTAGAPGFTQANWNNLGFVGTNINVLDSSGVPSGVVVSWVSANMWSQSGGGNPGTQGGPDANLMNGYLDSNAGANTTMQANMFNTAANNNRNWPLVYFTGLSAWMAAQGVTAYDLVIYADGDDSGNARTGEYWTIDASGSPTALTYGGDQVSHVFICDRANFTTTGAYAQVPLFVQSGGGAQFGNFPGNYAVFTSLTNDTFMLRDEEFNTRSVINAIQIIPRATAGPATIAPLPDAPTLAHGTVQLRGVVAGRLPFSYQWKKNGVNLANVGNISGANTATLTISNVTAADVAGYTLVVTNPGGVATSSVSALTIVNPTAGSYAEKIATNNPYAYWRFNEANDPSTNYAPAYDIAGGFTGIYGNAALNGYNGVTGPQPTDFPGFENGNTALQSASTAMRTWVTAPALNLNTNAVTMCGWIYPTAAQGGATALLFCRNGNDVAGLGYGNNNNLGYTWNSNSAATYNFASGLVPLTNAWSFVALTVSPTNAVLYLYNTNGQLSVTNAINHTNQAFSGLTYIGCDPSSAATPQGRSFTGMIDEMAVFNRTLPQTEIYNLYKKGLGLAAIAPVIPIQPQSLALFEGRTAKFNVTASGDAPLSFHWRKNGVNLSNGGNISGATTPSLTISNITIANDSASYDLVVGNIAGSLNSSVVTLTVVASNSAPTAYEAKLRTANPISYWRLNEANGSPYSYDYWGGIIATNENVTLGVSGPLPPDYKGFEAGNTAAQYDGLSAATDSSAVGLLNNRSQFSVVGWFNTAGPIGLRVGLFGQNDVVEFGFHGQDPDSPTGQGILGMWTPGGAAFLSQTNVIPGVWYLIAGVGSGTNVSVILLSTNGGGGFQVVQASTSGTTTNYGSSADSFRIGGGGILDTPGVNGNFFTGIIDEVAVFDRALSVGELSDLFGAAFTGGDLPPGISSQTGSLTLYAGRTATFSVNAVGTSLQYHWRKNGVPLADSGNLSGSLTGTLTITNVSAANIASYDVVITNSVGSITSSVVTLGVITPAAGGYEAAVIAANPLAYYRLNETNDPSSGTVVGHDYWGGHNGVYGVGALNGFNGILGPVPPIFTFETNNTGIAVSANTVSSHVTAPFGSLSTNTVTMTMWIQPTGTFDVFAGLLVNRNSGIGGGFGYTGGQLGYTWNNDSGATWGFRSGLVPPLNQWSFVALVVEPTQATLYMINPDGVQSATNVLAHTSDVFGNNWRIGTDDLNNDNSGARDFTGLIDEVAVFNYAMTPAQIKGLYSAGGPPSVTLNIQSSGANVVLTWAQGTLLQATSVAGPWTTNNATSPYTTSPAGAQKFYRVIVK
ncbi:LamG-like jellyroll fold domain-containing protein [Pedosphaera parvula]|uniref:Immunoglobulin I-set domain protein n=1 Tax=Pedosphaera parvula (strain Ellin514) TaxID=320771 RepID=B9XQP7_PEDPL|nr:LamG-like jellyroll fold domain-containing protein [Pedosphaera parvula]EEF57829.1 Immunoglobulin I-set domain protein [Pedosphaera parvula Ellin514]